MATYYIDWNSGNDTTGDGSIGLPWKTFSKAILSTTGGDNVKAVAGTYEENTDATGYWAVVGKVYASECIFESASGLDDVIVKGASGAYNTLIRGDTRNLTLKHIQFANRAAGQGCLEIRDTTNIKLDLCTAISADAGNLIYVVPSVGPCTGLTISGGTYRNTKVGGAGIFFNGLSAAVNNLTLQNAAVVSYGDPIKLRGNFANFLISANVSRDIADGSKAIQIGADAAVAEGTLTGTVTGNSISANKLGHGLLIGAGCSNVTVSDNKVDGGLWGIVVKENAGTILTGNYSHCRSGPALYFKAATGASATGNCLVATGGYAVQVGVGDTGNKCGTITLTDNDLIAFLTGRIFNWATASGDNGGCVVDRNKYHLLGSGDFGAVRGDAAVATMAELRAAWAGYDITTNDIYSHDVVHDAIWRSATRLLGI